MALDILHDNWGPYTHTEVENALKAYLSGLEDRINQAIQSGGVGLTDLSQEVQALLAKANTALQPSDIAAWAKAQNKPGYTADEITGITGFLNLLAKLQDMDQKIQAAAQSGVTVDPQLADSGNPVANRAVKTAIDTLTNTLNTLIGSGNVQDAIDTFNEVKAFLSGIDMSSPAYESLTATLTRLNNLISQKQNTLTSDDTIATVNGTPLKYGGTIAIEGGQDGEDGVGFDDVTSAQDGTMVITLSNGDTMTIDLKHNHPQYVKAELKTQAEYDALTTKDSQTLYIITDAS